MHLLSGVSIIRLSHDSDVLLILLAAAIGLLLVAHVTGGTLNDITGKALSRSDPSASERITQWRDLVVSAKSAPLEDKLRFANTFFNEHIIWEPDDYIWGTDDYWATPLETLIQGQGDCEDYAIAKYTSLVLMGVPPESLRMVYVKADINGITQAHMVLTWYEQPTSEPLILDNLYAAILPASKRRDLRPVFSFNGSAIWIGNSNTPNGGSPSARLSRWKQVIEKMQAEGFAQLFQGKSNVAL